MKIEPEQILAQYSPAIKSVIQQSFEDWQGFHKKRIFELQSILNSFKILLVHTEEWAQKPDKLWQELETEMSKVRLWTESLKYISPENLKNRIAEPLFSEFEKIVSEQPAELRILIGETYWDIQPGDSLGRRLRKKWQPIKITVNSAVNNLVNKYRNIKHKPPVKLKPTERVIAFHSLLAFYIKNPVFQFLIDEWQRYLQAITGQLFVLHLRIKEFANKSLILGELESIIDPNKPNEIFDNLFELAEVLKNIDETLEALEKYENQYANRFDKRWAEISETFLNAWNWAGTFQLKNKNYNGEQLVHLEYSIGSRLRKYGMAWDDNFTALQGEWQKDSELSLLRYKTVRNLHKNSQQIFAGIQNEIDPYFIQVKDLITSTTDEIDTSQDESSLHKLITKNRKSILNALQELLESIHGVNIVHVLEDYLNRQKAAVNNLGEQHRIFVKQDIDVLPPHSIIDVIPLKELVKREVFSKFDQKYVQTIQTTEVKNKYILRVISEIDQLIEFNVDSALKLLSQSGDLPVVERAKHEVVEGLNRSEKLLSDLRREIAAIPEICSKALLEYSLEFETDLEHFIESERLFKFKAQLKRRRFLKKIAELIGKTTHALKSVFPFLIRASVKSLQKVWTQYFSLTPHTNEWAESNGNRTKRYLTETEYRISKLPYIYQKLFHFETLNDNRFFTGRNTEINILKEEYNNWQEGSLSTIAIVGERGSGLTTFLNFAENEIFNDTQHTRIVFTKPDYTEENIINMICDAFHIKPVSSWDDLKQEISENNEYKVCILENMQYMFLKIVSGFNGLENFLHFISQTKHSIFWVISCTLYSWDFLRKAIGINNYFSRHITLNKISSQELKSIILKRHRASGYHIEFEIEGNPTKKKKLKKVPDENPHHLQLEEQYFNHLHKLASGNLSTAILLWLRSIKEFSKDKMVLSTDYEFDFSFLNKLSEENLFTLGAILHHELLPPENHSLIFNQNIDKSRLQLENLAGEGLLVITGYGYQIHPFIYRPLVQTLKKMNILT